MKYEVLWTLVGRMQLKSAVESSCANDTESQAYVVSDLT